MARTTLRPVVTIPIMFHPCNIWKGRLCGVSGPFALIIKSILLPESNEVDDVNKASETVRALKWVASYRSGAGGVFCQIPLKKSISFSKFPVSYHLLKLFYDELRSFSTFFVLNFDQKLAVE